jgi:succinate dehydrogenase flavin-adding protein (antitoxin of CptAB toxin-antitoxin module)
MDVQEVRQELETHVKTSIQTQSKPRGMLDLDTMVPLATKAVLHFLNENFGDYLEKVVQGLAPQIQNFAGADELKELRTLVELLQG